MEVRGAGYIDARNPTICSIFLDLSTDVVDC